MLRGEIEPLGSIPEARPARARHAIGPSGGRRRVWLVGIDGFSPVDFGLRRKRHPYAALQQLAHQGRSTLDARVPGGPALCGEEGRFESAPGWANILTGRDCRDHGVTHNDETAFLREHIDRLPSLLATAHRELGLVTAAVGSFPPLSSAPALHGMGLEPYSLLGIEGFEPGDDQWSNLDGWIFTRGVDSLAETATIEAIVRLDADLVFTHFDEVDTIGHMRGYGSKGWAKRLDRTDERIGRVLAAIRGEGTEAESRRRAFEQEDWLIVVISDHGGHDTPGCHDGSCCVPGFGHCGNHDVVTGVDDRVPFVVASMGGLATPLAPLQEPVSQLDVRPTILAWLGRGQPDSPGRIQSVQAIGIGAPGRYAPRTD